MEDSLRVVLQTTTPRLMITGRRPVIVPAMASDDEPAPPLVALGAGDLPDEAFKLIVDMTAYPFVVINSDGSIRYAGGSIERVLGRPADQVAGLNVVEFLSPD